PWVNRIKVSNPEGVASCSPGLPSAATLGKSKQGFQPRRGCVVQPQGCRPRLPWVNRNKVSNPEGVASCSPRVAVRGYPGKIETRFPTLKGLRRAAQGCRPRLPWVNRNKVSNPEGVASCSPGLPSAATLGKSKQGFQP